jgi:hypothetical protein
VIGLAMLAATAVLVALSRGMRMTAFALGSEAADAG